MKLKLNLKNNLLFLHLTGWLIAQFIYVPLGISGDQDNFLYIFSANVYSANGLATLFYRIPGLLLPGFLPTLVITTISAYIIYKVTLPFYPFIDKFLFWSVNLLPHFLIWSGIASKEALYIPLAICVCAYSVNIFISPYKKLCLESPYSSILFACMFILRPQFTCICISFHGFFDFWL